MHAYIIYAVLSIGFAAILGLYILARRKHRTAKQEAQDLITALTYYGTKLETGLLERVRALEQGGHLAAGTTQQLINSQVTPNTTNGSPAPSRPVPTA